MKTKPKLIPYDKNKFKIVTDNVNDIIKIYEYLEFINIGRLPWLLAGCPSQSSEEYVKDFNGWWIRSEIEKEVQEAIDILWS